MDLETKVLIRIIVRWLLVALSLSAASLMIWYFIKIFVKENKYSIPLTIALSIILIIFYIIEHRVAW